MAEIHDLFWEAINHPVVRAMSVLISTVSLIVSVLLYKKTTDLMATQKKDIQVEQTRSIFQMWQQSNSLALSRPEHVSAMRDMFNYQTNDDVIRTYMLFNLINPIFIAWTNWNEGTASKTIFDAHINTILSHYTGDRTWFAETLRSRGYPSDFVSVCSEWFAVNAPPQARVSTYPGSIALACESPAIVLEKAEQVLDKANTILNRA